MYIETEKPAIAHICLSQGWGGLEMYPIRTGKESIGRGYKTYGICVAGTQVANGMKAAGIETFEVSSKRSLVFSQIAKLDKWLRDRNVTIIHSHKSGDILVSSLLNVLAKRKAFFTEHMGVTRPKKDLYHRWVYSHLERIFSISDETYKRNINALPIKPQKLTRLWLGTDIPEYPIEDVTEIEKIKKELAIPIDSVVIGNIGRLCIGKGQLELIEAFSLLKQSTPNIHLLLVGGLDVSEGSDNAFVKTLKDRISTLDLAESVHLVGFRKDTNRMLAAMDIVCLPNHDEAFGLTAIEAMAAKKAIVGSNTGALPEILEPVALLCNPLSPQSIADKIEEYLTDQGHINQNAQKAYERAQSEFSMKSHVNKLFAHYLSETKTETKQGHFLRLRLRNKVKVEPNNMLSIAKSSKIRQCKISIKGFGNQLIIDDNVNIRRSHLEIDGNNCLIHIKKNSIIGHNCYLSAREKNIKLVVGENCMFSRNVKIMTSDGHNIIKEDKRINFAKSIHIGSHVWLADSVTLLKGVKVGDNSIVGINSTLTKNSPSGSITAGNPAKIVQKDVTWQHEIDY